MTTIIWVKTNGLIVNRTKEPGIEKPDPSSRISGILWHHVKYSWVISGCLRYYSLHCPFWKRIKTSFSNSGLLLEEDWSWGKKKASWWMESSSLAWQQTNPSVVCYLFPTFAQRPKCPPTGKSKWTTQWRKCNNDFSVLKIRISKDLAC